MRRLVAQLTVAVAVVVMAVPASADDATIAKQIVAKLNQQKQAANLKGFDLGVQVDQGTVTMMGQVASSEQALLALDVARRIPGVKLVVNDLNVATKTQPASSPVVMSISSETPVTAETASEVAAKPAVATPAAAPSPQSVLANYNATGAVGSAIAQPQPQRPVAFAPSQMMQRQQVAPANYVESGGYAGETVISGGSVSGNPAVPGYAWPSYAAAPNYGAVAYPQQYSATAWPYIGPFYPYPQVPLGWRKVSLEWDDGWWFLDFTKK